MKQLLYLFFLQFAVSGCNDPEYKNPHIVIETNLGDIEAELYPDKAPKTVAAFLMYVDSGFYKNSSFYRVIFNEGFSTASNTGVIQGGTWPSDNKEHPIIKGIPHEPTKQTGLTHTTGTLSMARSAPGTASTEFFICIGDQTQFDFGSQYPADGQGLAAFGKVTKGMDIVRKIQEQRSSGENFDEKIIIKTINRL